VLIPGGGPTGTMLVVPIYRGREVTGFAQADTGVDVVASSPRTRRCE
jgi:hypothetical protein